MTIVKLAAMNGLGRGALGLLVGALLLPALAGCAPEPLGPDATAPELAAACDAGDLDACSRAAHMRADGYEAAMRVN